MTRSLPPWANRKDYQSCLALLESQVKEFEKYIENLTVHDQAQLLLAISRVWYLSGNLSKALGYINKILNKAALLINQQLHLKCQLTYMMIHKALNNRELLSYEIRSYERRIKKEGKNYKAALLVISVLKNWISFKSTKKFYPALLQLMDDPFEQVLISELQLRSWFEENC